MKQQQGDALRIALFLCIYAGACGMLPYFGAFLPLTEGICT